MGKFEIIKSVLDGVLLIEMKDYADERGYFMESYNKADFEKIGIKTDFIQDNESFSCKNVMRGLHFQNQPFAQGKLVRVIKGKIKDVVVDIRKNSPTYGKWQSFTLNSSKNMLWVPKGFAHGFLSLEDNTIVHYKVDAPYNKESEGGLLWNDPSIAIKWEVENPIVSEKDNNQPVFKNIVPFE